MAQEILSELQVIFINVFSHPLKRSHSIHHGRLLYDFLLHPFCCRLLQYNGSLKECERRKYFRLARRSSKGRLK
jgi:hypothetical protein